MLLLALTKNSASVRNNHSVNLDDECYDDDHGDHANDDDDGDHGDHDNGDHGDENLICWPIVDHTGHLTAVLRVEEHSLKNHHL